MINYQYYKLPQGSNLNPALLKAYINKFWEDYYKAAAAADPNSHLLLMCKVHFSSSHYKESGGLTYRSLGALRRVNYTDKDLFIEYLIARLSYFIDSYHVTPIDEIHFSYVRKSGLASGDRLLSKDSNPAACVGAQHSYNNLQLPLSMDPNQYGEILGTAEFAEGGIPVVRYIVEGGKAAAPVIYEIKVIYTQNQLQINNVQIKSQAGIKWSDTQISDNIFRRDLDKNTFYIKDSNIIIKQKELPAKPFKIIKKDNNISSIDNIMTMDIETVNIDGSLLPYLIFGYGCLHCRSTQFPFYT